jgi:hypothetical protein
LGIQDSGEAKAGVPAETFNVSFSFSSIFALPKSDIFNSPFASIT